MFKTEQVTFSYDKEEVLRDISIEIHKGDFLGIIGPNGSGKTTLLKILAKILSPKKGNLYIEGKDIKKIPPAEYSRKVAYLPSQTELSFSYTVEDFVMIGRFPYTSRYRSPSDRDIEITAKVMEQFEIKQHRKRKVWELSDGEKQRVFISQVIAQESSVILLDEPTSHLDIGHNFRIMDILKEINRNEITVIAILHELNLASEYCSHILLLNEGQVFCAGIPEKVITYQNIENVYGTKVLVYNNPHTGKPYVFGLPAEVITKKSISSL